MTLVGFRAVGLLVEYMEANKILFNNLKMHFQIFTKHLCSGTIGEYELDLSGLYWIPTATENTNKLYCLTKYS